MVSKPGFDVYNLGESINNENSPFINKKKLDIEYHTLNFLSIPYLFFREIIQLFVVVLVYIV